MNRILRLRTIGTLLTAIVLLLGGTLAATGSPSLTATPTPMPVVKQPAHTGVLPADLQAALPPEIDSRGPYIYLTNYTFDPLSEATPHSLPADLTLSNYPPGEEGYYLLQFHGPIQPAWKEAIVAAGAQTFDYIPDFAFVVKMDDATKAAVEAADEVRWVGLYQPGYRIAPSLMSALASPEGAELADVTVVVFRDEDMAALTDRLQEMGGTILDVTETHWKGKIRIQIPHSQINAVAHLSGIKWIEPSPEWKLFNNEAADIMGVREVWDTHGLYGAGQTVAVCDTGLDQGSTLPGSLHDDFEDGSGSSRVATIYDRVGDGADDVNSGHGTHVAGSVLGNGDRSGSTPSSHTYPNTAYVGMAPEASLVFQAVENNSTGALSGIPSDLNTLFDQARNAGARIHTNSWGSAAAGAYTSSSEDVDEFVWDHRIFTILFAAGNEGIDNNADGVVDLYSTGSPGTAKNCITVGATENDRPSISNEWGDFWPTQFPVNPIHGDRIADDPDGMAAFSSRGSALDGRFKPDVVASGTYIASVRSSVASGGGWGTIDSYYMYNGGTSMATPLVAGTAALVRDFYTDIEGIIPSASLIKATLINGATDISPGQYGTGSTQEIPDPPRPNNVEGWGRVNVENAVFPTAPRELIYYEETSGLNTGGESVYSFEVTDSSEPLKVTLAWSDYPGSPAAAGGLVNDLDLSVTAPGGTVYYPNNATQYLQYDSGPYYVISLSSGRGAAVRFTPTSYPVQLDKALFFVYASSYPTTFTCNVWDDDGTGGEPGTNLFSTSTTARGTGWLVVDISGVTITSGSFYIEMRVSGSNPQIVSDDDGMTDNRSWYYDGSSWGSWLYDRDIVIHAVMVGDDYSTSFDRVNNVVGVDIDTPTLGTYTIRVQGHNVPYGPQPYALVASGAITGAPNSPPVIADLPDQTVPMNGSADNAIDLWDYAGDAEDNDSDLTFTISNSPDPNAGVSIDSNRYIDINPTSGWTGTTDVEIQVEDTGGLTGTDSFQVEVLPVAPFPFCDSFESGSLDTVWTTYTTLEGRVQVSSTYPYSGTYSVLLDDSTNNTTYSHAAIILTIDLSGQSDVDLDFWWRDFGDEDDADDGVFLSDDWGTTWFNATNFTSNQSSFKNEIVDVDARAATNGLTLNDHFQIKFQFYDNYPIPSDGYAIDELCVYAPSFPDIEVSPTSFEEWVPQDDVVTKTLTISNTGTDSLTFSISEVPGSFTPLMLSDGPGLAQSLDETGNLPQELLLSPIVPLDLGDIVNSFSAPASGFIGLEWIHGYLWAASSSNSMLYKLDPVSGAVLETISVPGSNTGGLAWDGSAFWFTDSEADIIAKMDISGTILLTFPAPSSCSVGLAWDGVYLWDVDWMSNELHKIDPSSGAVLHTILSPDTRPAGVAWDGQYLWTNGRDSATTYKLDPTDGSVVSSFSTPPGTGFNNGQGAAFDSQYLWIENYDVQMIYQIDVEYVALDVPWLSEDPISGTVSADDSLSVDVIFDATGLALGDYTADLVINNNDPDENPVTVPITMHVTDNYPPNPPSNPSPADGATGVSINADLSWTGGDPDPGDTVTYDVYFGAGTPGDLICDDVPAPECDPGELTDGTQYYWYVVATDNHGTSTTGPTWDFTTNNTPNTPSNPSPADGAIGQDIDVDLGWTGGDPDPGDTVTYTVYLEANDDTPDNLISSCDGTSTPACDPGTLGYDTHYYWYVVATDNHGASTMGDTWNFTTTLAPAPAPETINPSWGYINQVVNVTVAGEHFQPGATAKLVRGEAAIQVDVGLVSEFQITGVVTLTNAAIDQWDVRVTNPDGQSGDLVEAFTVKERVVYLPVIFKNRP